MNGVASKRLVIRGDDAETSLRRVGDWLADDLHAWVYARPAGGGWAIFVPAFSIAAWHVTLEGAFDQARTLLVGYFASCLDAGKAFNRSGRPSSRRVRLGLALTSVAAERIAAARGRPPTVRRSLVTARWFNQSGKVSVDELLESIRRQAKVGPA
jgi:hypothetical protein